MPGANFYFPFWESKRTWTSISEILSSCEDALRSQLGEKCRAAASFNLLQRERSSSVRSNQANDVLVGSEHDYLVRVAPVIACCWGSGPVLKGKF